MSRSLAGNSNFARTAVKTKKINVKPRVSRGGRRM